MGKTFTSFIEHRFSDFDLYGHVNNVAYFSFLEIARINMVKDFFKEMTNNHLFLLVAHAECTYIQPIQYGDQLVVSSTISRIGNTSFDIDYRLNDGYDTTYATARTVMVCFDNIKKKTVSTPDCIREIA